MFSSILSSRFGSCEQEEQDKNEFQLGFKFCPDRRDVTVNSFFGGNFEPRWKKNPGFKIEKKLSYPHTFKKAFVDKSMDAARIPFFIDKSVDKSGYKFTEVN